MPDSAAPALLGERARALRLLMWVTTAVGALMLLAAYAGAKGIVPRATGAAALYLFGACVVLVLYFGTKSRSLALEDRERQSRQSMVVVIAAQLARQDETTLEQIARRGGPAAEAALMILAGRRKKGAGDGHVTPA